MTTLKQGASSRKKNVPVEKDVPLEEYDEKRTTSKQMKNKKAPKSHGVVCSFKNFDKTYVLKAEIITFRFLSRLLQKIRLANCIVGIVAGLNRF